MSRVVSIGMNFQADFSAVDAAYKAKVAELQSSVVRVPIGATGSAAAASTSTSTLGGLSVPTSAGLPIGASSPNISYFFSQLGQQLSSAIAQLGRTLSAGGGSGGVQPANQPPVPGVPGARQTRGRGIFGLLGASGPQVIAGYFAYRGLSELGRQYAKNRDLDETLQYEGPEAAARLAAQQTRSDRENLPASLLRSAIAGFTTAGQSREDSIPGRVASGIGQVIGIATGFGAGVPGLRDFQSDDSRAAEDRKTEALIKAGQFIDASRERARAATRRIESVGEAPYFQQKHAITNRAEDTRREQEQAKREALEVAVAVGDPSIYDSTRVAANDAIKRANTLEAVENTQNYRDRVYYPKIAIGHTDEVLSERANNRSDRANRLEVQYAGQERIQKLRDTQDPTLQSVETEEADRLRAFDREIQNRNESITQSQKTQFAVVNQLLNRNVVGAEAAGVTGGALSKGLAFEHQGLDDFAQREYRLGAQELQLTKQQYLDAFHGQQVNPFAVDLTNTKRTDDPGKTLEEINKGIQTLISKLTVQN